MAICDNKQIVNLLPIVIARAEALFIVGRLHFKVPDQSNRKISTKFICVFEPPASSLPIKFHVRSSFNVASTSWSIKIFARMSKNSVA
jgi:hypothetical protein